MIGAQSLTLFAFRPLVSGACQALGLGEGELTGERVANFLRQRFSDASQRLPAALRRAIDRSWRALEIALAGESLRTWLDRADDKALRQQVRLFLVSTPWAGLPG